MANITTVLKYSLKTNIVKSILFEIISNTSRYFYTFGRSSAWPTVIGPRTSDILSIQRANNTVTIGTLTPHELNVNESVIVSAVTNTTLNGTFTVTSVPTATSFTYTKSGSNITQVLDTGEVASVQQDVISSEDDPPSAADSYPYELTVRNDMLYMKLIDSNDAAIVVPRRNWVPGVVYDMYDDYSGDRVSFTGATSLENSTFYVLTDEFNVYKCLFNNNNGQSSVKPIGTSEVSFSTSDGYTWKFMYSIPLSLRNKFLTTSYMPVISALANQFYSNGAITNYTISSPGKSYTANSYKVKAINVINGGSGYLSAQTGTNPTANISNIQLTAGVVTVTTSSAHGYLAGQAVSVNCTSNTSINGNYVIQTIPSTTTFTYLKTGSNITSTSATGTVKNTGLIIVFPLPPSGGVQAQAHVNSYSEGGQILQITVTNQGSGYVNPPLPTIISPSTGSGVNYTIDYDKDTAGGYTELVVTGDGYNSSNPYSIKTVNIVDRGEFNAVVSGEIFTFPEPSLPGRKPILDVTFRVKTSIPSTIYEIDTINIIDGGYGYTSPLVLGTNVFANDLTINGFTGNLDTASQKNDAVLLPLINSSGEIEAIKIADSGIGYTFASVSVIAKKLVSGSLVDISTTNTPTYKPASIILNFAVGNIDSKQSNVELFAVNGSIEVIKVDAGGYGYTNTTQVTVIGDGTGCTAQPVITNGVIRKILVTNIGSGYTSASIQLSELGGGAAAGTSAILRPIISPRGGHGKDAVSELYARTINFVTRLSGEKNRDIVSTNDYRQITILKNPLLYNASEFYKNSTGSSCVVLICDINTSNSSTYSQLVIDDILYYTPSGSTVSKSFNLIEKTIVNNKYYLLIQPLNNFIPPNGSTVYKVSGSNTYNINISSILYPEFNKFSGEMLYIDNKTKFSPNSTQSIVISTLISF